jgi:hypothetical protein
LQDTGAVFMTRGAAAANVFEKQTAFADLSLQKNMTTVITEFWRLQPEYDARRFDFTRLGKASAAEKSCFRDSRGQAYSTARDEACSSTISQGSQCMYCSCVANLQCAYVLAGGGTQFVASLKKKYLKKKYDGPGF